MTSTYRIAYAVAAVSDLRTIYNYLENITGEASIATSNVRAIREAAQALSTFPKRHPVLQNEPWHSLELRRAISKPYALFYLVDDATLQVTITRIVYAGRNLSDLTLT
jgi:plasmid stabilization system protein ParE